MQNNHELILLVEDFPEAANTMIEAFTKEYEVHHVGSFQSAVQLINRVGFDHYVFDIDFPKTHLHWLKFLSEAMGRKVSPSEVARRYVAYENGFDLFKELRKVRGNDVHVLFQSGSYDWGYYERQVIRLKQECSRISFIPKDRFLEDPLKYFKESITET
ncbi:MAG: hypothetical protein HY731_05445 [Candidatus Tectomicrobia bacterium]|nr:hypothetical protein [Candidatus Tectomicrobia bacterium]